MKPTHHTKNQKAKLQRGFTLVETLVAITVLMVSIVGPMTIAAKGIQTAYLAKDQITAFYLAQEEIEFVRAIRDYNALDNISPPTIDWLKYGGLDLATACKVVLGSSVGCSFDVRFNTAGLPKWKNCASASANACRVYYAEPSATTRGIYTNTNTGVATQFTRVVTIKEIVPNKEAEIIVTVSWKTGSLSRDLVVKSRIFNHYDNL